MMRFLGPLALAAGIAAGALAPLAVRAATARPPQPETITYDAGLQGSFTHPMVGEALAGRMRLTINPDGIIQGNYIPDDGTTFPVAGGLETSGRVWLTLGRTTINGQLMGNGEIVGSSFANGPLDALKFVAQPLRVPHPQTRG